jgi:hypothetical protein
MANDLRRAGDPDLSEKLDDVRTLAGRKQELGADVTAVLRELALAVARIPSGGRHEIALFIDDCDQGSPEVHTWVVDLLRMVGGVSHRLVVAAAISAASPAGTIRCGTCFSHRRAIRTWSTDPAAPTSWT